MSLGGPRGRAGPGWGESASRRGPIRGGGGGGGAGGDGGSYGGNGGGSGKGPRRSGGGGGAADSSGNPLAALWSAYNERLAAYPIATKAFTSMVGFFLGDLLAQKFIGEKGSLDVGRLARMASFGLLIHGPTGHYFYNALDRSIPGTAPLQVATKVAVDQVLWAPIFTALFFAYLGVTERKSTDQIVSKIKNDTWTGVTTSWKFWPLAHTINFAFIPGAQRLLYINTLQVGYNVILSLLGNK